MVAKLGTLSCGFTNENKAFVLGFHTSLLFSAFKISNMVAKLGTFSCVFTNENKAFVPSLPTSLYFFQLSKFLTWWQNLELLGSYSQMKTRLLFRVCPPVFTFFSFQNF